MNVSTFHFSYCGILSTFHVVGFYPGRILSWGNFFRIQDQYLGPSLLNKQFALFVDYLFLNNFDKHYDRER